MSIHTDPRLDAILAKVRRIELHARGLVDDVMAGRYASRFRGRGMEFDEVREYVPGDDVRAIDWNVTARAGRPFVKRFVEERELTVMLLVDVSGSTEYGSVGASRRELAAEVAAVMALSAAEARDKVGVALFSDRIEGYVPPGKGRRHALRVVEEVLEVEPEGLGTDLSAAVRFVNETLSRRAVVIVVSDFLVPSTGGRSLADELKLLRVRHDVVAVHLVDPAEQTLPEVGRVILEDAEDDGGADVIVLHTGDPAVRRRYHQLAQARHEAIARSFRDAAVDHLTLAAGESWVAPLSRFLEQRHRS